MLFRGLLLIGEVLLLAQARSRPLREAYPWFWLWLLFAIIRGALLLPLDPERSPWYSQVWATTLWLALPVQLMVAWEWTRALGKHYPGRGRVANGILLGACSLALGLSIFTIESGELEWRSHQAETRQVTQAMLAQRLFGTALPLALFLISGVYRFFGANGIPKRENLAIQQAFLIAVWSLQALGYWVIYISDASAWQLVNLVLGLAGPILFTAWAIALRPEGEAVRELAIPSDAARESVARLEGFIERSRDPK